MTRRTTRRTTTSAADRVIFVKVAKTGGAVVEVTLNNTTGKTVADALDAADMELANGQRIRVDGRAADEDTTLKDGSVIVISGSIKGGN